MLRRIINILVIAIFLSDCTYADYIEECEGVTSKFIAVPEDCSFFIYCDGEDSFQDSCTDDSPYFSEIFQTCDVANTVCGNRPYANSNNSPSPPTVVTITTLAPTTTPVANSSSTAVSSSSSVPTNVTFFIPTVSSPIPIPTNPISTVSPVTSTPSSPISSTSSTLSPVIPLACPAIDDPNNAIFLSNPKSCSDYFLCYHGQPLPMHCSNMLHFDIKQQKCNYAENVKCQMNFVKPREQCLPHTFDVYPHPSNCNYYYLCSFGYLKVMQCPLKLGWDYERRSCVLLQQAKCYNSLQRF